MTDRKLYRQEDAEKFFSKLAGKPYRPSNGSEGELFYDAWCSGCKRDADFKVNLIGPPDGCLIIANTMAYRETDPNYPKEWVYGEDGQPKCTAFEAVDDPRKRVDADAVGDLFIHIEPKDACQHEFVGWREFADGNGGEAVCKHCGIGAMAYTLRTEP